MIRHDVFFEVVAAGGVIVVVFVFLSSRSPRTLKPCQSAQSSQNQSFFVGGEDNWWRESCSTLTRSVHFGIENATQKIQALER